MEKGTFIQSLMDMTGTDITEFVYNKGKVKPVFLFRIVDKPNKAKK